jgi:hypothetical protein
LLAATDTLLEEMQTGRGLDDRIPYESGLAFARSQLNGEEFDVAWRAGQAMTMEQAIAYALEEDPTGS